jgi:hypothetical protein
VNGLLSEQFSLVDSRKSNSSHQSLEESSAMTSPKQEIECCPVCYDGFEDQDDDDDDVDMDVDVEAGRGGGRGRIELECRHVFCRNCLLEYCRHNIAIQRIPIPCPTIGNNKDVDVDDANHLNYCEQVLQNGLVEDILQNDDNDNDNSQHLIKFRRFQQMAQDPALMPCPKCGELVSRLPLQQEKEQSLPVSLSSSSSSEDKDIVKDKKSQSIKHETAEDAPLSCHSCYHTFCAVHGDAHPDISCSDYQRSREARQIRKSEASLKQWTKSCSHCGARIHKAAGCDHVLCPACHHDMCFKCGTHLHLSGKVIRSCSKCQQGFVDHRYTRQYRIRQCMWLPFVLPGMLFYVAVMSVVAILTLGFGCCFRCGIDVADREQETGSSRNRGCAPCRGIQRGVTLVFLPLVGILRDFGFRYCHDFDEMFVDENEIKEIPTLSIENDDESLVA